MEMAAATGLPLVEGRKTPQTSTTFDVDQLIKSANGYGITVSRDIEGLMISSRCCSMDAVDMSSARIMPICMAIGEGVGAALAVKHGISSKAVDVREVREILLKSGMFLAPVEK